MSHSKLIHSVYQPGPITSPLEAPRDKIQNNAYQINNAISISLIVYIYPSAALVFQAVHYFL